MIEAPPANDAGGAFAFGGGAAAQRKLTAAATARTSGRQPVRSTAA